MNDGYVPPAAKFLGQHFTAKQLAAEAEVSESSARRYLNDELALPADAAARLANRNAGSPVGKAIAESSLLSRFQAFPLPEPAVEEMDQDHDGDVDARDAELAAGRVSTQAAQNAEQFMDRMVERRGVLDDNAHLETVRGNGELHRRVSLFAAICRYIRRPTRRRLGELTRPQKAWGKP